MEVTWDHQMHLEITNTSINVCGNNDIYTVNIPEDIYSLQRARCVNIYRVCLQTEK